MARWAGSRPPSAQRHTRRTTIASAAAISVHADGFCGWDWSTFAVVYVACHDTMMERANESGGSQNTPSRPEVQVQVVM